MTPGDKPFRISMRISLEEYKKVTTFEEYKEIPLSEDMRNTTWEI